MNVRVPVLVGMVILGMAMAATAGGDNAKKIVGVWEPVKGKDKGIESTLEFTKDGKLKISAKFGDKAFNLEGTYKLKGETISIAIAIPGTEKSKEDTAKIIKLNDTELHLEDTKGKVEEFKRVK